MITAVLDPSETIAVGYDSTWIKTRSNEELTGVIKEATDSYIGLMGWDGKLVRIPTSEIVSQRGDKVSFMPAGFQSRAVAAGVCRLDRISGLAETAASATLTSHRGMPANIPEIPKPIAVRPFIGESLRFPHSVVENGRGVRSGLTWFGQLPGVQQRVPGRS